jgi:deoxyribonuclease V
VRRLHRPLTYAAAVRRQLALRARVIAAGAPRRVRLVAGADISYAKDDDTFFAAVVLLDARTMEVVESATAVGKSPFPYVPGLLSFRESPLLLRAFRKLRRAPDLLFVDGHGIAHPRRFGIACHLGLQLDVPAIGCAKKRLVGEAAEPPAPRGSWTPLLHEGRRVGAALRTRSGVKPVFVSPGHRIGLSAAIRWVLRCDSGFRAPAPLREAHRRCNDLRRARGVTRAYRVGYERPRFGGVTSDRPRAS